MDAIERELFAAVLNCYNACHGSFEETIKMISDARNLDIKYTKKVLDGVKAKYSNTDEYKAIRSRLPKEFGV